MWLNPPSTSWTSQPEPEPSAQVSSTPSPNSAFTPKLFAVSSGKLLPRPRSWRGWKTRQAAARLFGTMQTPSSVDGTGAPELVAALTSSAAGIHVSPFPRLGDALVQKMTDTFGLHAVELLRDSNPASCSLKTFQVMSHWGSTRFSKIWSGWVTELRSDSLRRRKSAHHINDSESLSLGFLTPSGVTGNHGPDGSECAKQAGAWATTRANEGGTGKRGGGRTDMLLLGQVMHWANWATARASASENRSVSNAPTHGKTHGMLLAAQAAQFANVIVPSRANWPTGSARDHKGINQHYASRGTLDQLPNAAEKWAMHSIAGSPAVPVHYSRLHGESTWRKLRKPLRKLSREDRKKVLFDLRCIAQLECIVIGRLLRIWNRPSCPRLNPAFQWWLMGWPRPQTFFGSAGTES